jgi:ABC-type multidrug transport system ATPase subunit
MVKCPEGNYCPPGTYEAKSCGPLSICPEGSEQPVFIGALLIVGLADLALLVVVYVYRFVHKRDHLKQLQGTYLPAFFTCVPSINIDVWHVRVCGVAIAMRSTDEVSISKGGIIVASQLPRPTRKLCKGFHRAKGELKHMDFEFSNLSMKLPTGQMILSGVTGRVAPGKVTAIMGPSGAGKTTFLYTLTGKMDAQCIRGGELSINGQQAELSAFKKVVGYVPQDDVMMRELTVWDNIMHSARVRLPDWSDEEVEGHVRAVIAALGLVEVSGIKIGDETSRGVSGGQRKRVNIGMELAAAPLALFLDEPTSGLDATAAMDVCNLLRDIAQETGITVAMVIHQPRVEIWNHLDDILLLAPGMYVHVYMYVCMYVYMY